MSSDEQLDGGGAEEGGVLCLCEFLGCMGRVGLVDLLGKREGD